MSKVRISLPTKPKDLWDAVRNLQQELRLMRSPYRASGTTAAQAQALLAIADHAPLNVAKLTEILFLDKSTVSQTLAQLSRNEWIKLEELPLDRRHKLVELTESGQERVRDIRRNALAGFEKVMEDLDESEANAVVYGLEMMSYALKQNRALTKSSEKAKNQENQISM